MNFEHGNIHTKPNGARGWVMGDYPALEGTPFHSKEVEVKWSHFAKGDKKSGKPAYNKEAKTVSILVSGKLRLDLPQEGTSVVLENEGDYLFFGAHVAHTWEALEDTFLITLRWPSIPGDQVEVEGS